MISRLSKGIVIYGHGKTLNKSKTENYEEFNDDHLAVVEINGGENLGLLCSYKVGKRGTLILRVL
jgi:hypothetical protein